MGDAALDLAPASAPQEPSWSFRLSQQAFAGLLEQRRRHSNFRVASQRRAARRGLSALSVDDRGRLERWLALQVLTTPVAEAADCLDALATVEPQLAGSVRSHLPRLAAHFATDTAAIAA